MNNNYRLFFAGSRTAIFKLVKLLHSLQEKSRVHAECEDLLKVGYIVVEEGKL